MKKALVVHLAAHTRARLPSICNPTSAPWLWSFLRRRFPEAYGCTLMPDHFHLVARIEDAATARRSLIAILGHYTRNFGRGESVWRPTNNPTPVQDVKNLQRSLRYIALNPCRERLSTDPLAWTWSTHRDVMGAICDPWVTAKRLAGVLGWPRGGFRDRYHAYVSSDPSVDVRGTPPPRPAPHCDVPQFTLADVMGAVQSAIREPFEAVQHRGQARALFIHLALSQGWRDLKLLARISGASLWTVRRILERPIAPEVLRAGLLCLNDARLRAGLKRGECSYP